jgi:uncharacterized protein YlxW (UPF0749 family)
MMFLQIPSPDVLATPASVLALIASIAIKHFIIDTKRNRKEDSIQEEKAQLLRELNQKMDVQIGISNARRETMEKLVDSRHEQNSERLDRIEQAIPRACRYQRGH